MLKRNSRSLYLGRMFSGVPVVRLRFRRKVQTGWERQHFDTWSTLQQLSIKNLTASLYLTSDVSVLKVACFVTCLSVTASLFSGGFVLPSCHILCLSRSRKSTEKPRHVHVLLQLILFWQQLVYFGFPFSGSSAVNFLSVGMKVRTFKNNAFTPDTNWIMVQFGPRPPLFCRANVWLFGSDSGLTPVILVLIKL